MVKKRKNAIGLLSKLYLSAVYLFLYIPIIVLIAYSFNDSRFRGAWKGFTFYWYQELFRDASIMSSVYTTVVVATVAALVATVIGTITAVGMHSMKPQFKALMTNLTYIPMVNPDIVIGVSMLAFFVMLRDKLGIHLELGYVTLILAHITFNLPYVVFAVLPKLQQLDSNLEEAALDLGATPVQAFFKVILPQIMPGIITGMLLSFTMSLDDFVVSSFTTGSGVTTLSIKIYSMTKRGVTPKINAISTILFVVIIAMIAIIQIRNMQSDKKKESTASDIPGS